jgi:hypothetical protein
MLSSEKLAAKARKWIGSHSERRGEANLSLEYVWGNGKKRNRKLCDFKMKTLRVTAFRCFQTTEPALVRKYFRKARNYQTVLREGADAFSIHKDVKELKKKRLVWGKAAAESQKPGSKGGAHASHRRPAPSEYNAE